MVERPRPTGEHPQQLCLDLGYDNPTGPEAVNTHPYVAHLRRIGRSSSIWPRASRTIPSAAGSSRARWPGARNAARCSGSIVCIAWLFRDRY